MSEELFYTSVFFVLGAIFGSFGNVIIYRLPKGENIAWPGSHCRACKTKIPLYLNIPILSWFILGGKCHNCKAPFSFRYPLVEIFTAITFATIYWKWGWSWFLLEYLLFAFALIVSSVIDLDHMILPDSFTLSGIVIGLVGAVLNPDRVFFDAALGVLVGGGFLYAIAYYYMVVRKIEGMGGGDIKLLAWIGAVLGWQSLPFVIIASSFVGLFFGVFYMMKSKKGLQTGIPFGPYLSIAALIHILIDVPQFMTWLFPFSNLAVSQ